jgi:hypothetical protein
MEPWRPPCAYLFLIDSPASLGETRGYASPLALGAASTATPLSAPWAEVRIFEKTGDPEKELPTSFASPRPPSRLPLDFKSWQKSSLNRANLAGGDCC